MNAHEVGLRPASDDWVHRWIVPPNPFYCLSACCMMIGCFLVSHELALTPGRVGGLLALIAAVQLYEAILIALGVWLVRRGGRTSDGWLLLVIESVFLVDAAHLNAEVAAADASVGLALAAALFVAAGAKTLLVVRFLRLPVERAQLAFILAGVAFVLGLPAVVAATLEPHQITAWVVYTLWWALASLVALHGFWPRPRADTAPQADVARRLVAVLAMMLYASAGLHLLALGWVYAVDVEPAFASPLLIALLPWIARLGHRLGWRHAAVAAAQMSLPLAAVLVAMPRPEALPAFELAAVGLTLSPFRITLLLAAGVYLGLALEARTGPPALAAVACLTAAALGQSPADIADTDRLGWGLVAVWFAFICLAVGAWGSLTHRPRPRAESTSPP